MNELNSRKIKWLAGLLLALLVVATESCYAQFSAAVEGTVQDVSGAAISKATVTLVNTATRVARPGTTNDQGIYRFVSLPPGDYTLKVVKSGFRTTIVPLNVGRGNCATCPLF